MMHAKPQKVMASMIVLVLVLIVVQVGETAEKGRKVCSGVDLVVAKVGYHVRDCELGCVHVINNRCCK